MMFISASVFLVLAVLAGYFAHKQVVYKRSETARLCSAIFLVLAVLFIAGGMWKWAKA